MARNEIPKKSEEPAMSVVEQLKALDEQRAALLETAKTAALAKANEAVAELNALGFNYSLAEGGNKPTVNHAPRAVKCTICEELFDPPHDKRSHRTHPGPFTADEIAARGWKVVTQ